MMPYGHRTTSKIMKNLAFASLAAALLCLAAFSQCTESQVNAQTTNAPSEADIIKRGEYLVGVLGCHDCHSPKRLGPNGPEIIPELHLSGYPADRPLGKTMPEALQNGWLLFAADGTATYGPWGVSFSANLTSDESGIGTWSFEQFKKALTEGKYKGLDGGRMLLPPMPWPNYIKMDPADMEAVFKYLKSTKPVKNVVPAPIPPAVN